MKTPLLAAFTLMLPLLAAAADPNATQPGWTVMGRQGIVLMVLVPQAEARDEAAYMREIESICKEEINCFLNFYTNTRNAPVAVPLPDEISHEVTATYRKTYKKGVPLFTWSCRMQMIADSCF
ncbi:hypothetical protein [Pelomonas sp. KK5]|uniref:hypothetical protein n=1 Tax=Pelomonas sp. KK5 TaxID=1855730 RepID=UPI00097C197E|nr:hypothetical protein [Pelomonas sp. KK5]